MQDDAGARTALAPAPTPVLGSDPHDFAGLYIRHRASFTSHARRYLRDPRDADEVVQEAFLRLFLAMPELESELQALAYCRRTITNLCIDRYRADARRPRLVALEGAPVEELADDDTGDPVVRAEDAALVREALSQLPALHRAALVMREIEEKSLPVIAEELDVPEDSVKHLLFRARRALRKLLVGTSVEPSVDAELTGGLRPLARGASGGLAGLLLVALVGLGSGPDLRAVPVVGVDLPDVLGVSAVADAVSGAVRDVVEGIVPASRAAAQPRADAVEPQGGRTAPAPDGAAARSSAGRAPVAGDPSSGQGVAPDGRRTTTVVTVVDGRTVTTVVPAAEQVPPSYVPGRAAPATVPAASTGRGLGPYVPGPVAPPSSSRDRDERTAGPDGVAVEAARGERSGRSPRAEDAPRGERSGRSPRAEDAPRGERSGRSPRADDARTTLDEPAGTPVTAPRRAAERGGGAADRAQRAADGSNDTAVGRAQRAAEESRERGQRAAAEMRERAADRAQRASDKAADRAEKAQGGPAVPAADLSRGRHGAVGDPQQAVVDATTAHARAAKAAQQAADRAERAVAKSAEKAGKAAEKAVEKADVAAEKAAARAARTSARAAEAAQESGRGRAPLAEPTAPEGAGAPAAAVIAQVPAAAPVPVP